MSAKGWGALGAVAAVAGGMQSLGNPILNAFAGLALIAWGGGLILAALPKTKAPAEAVAQAEETATSGPATAATSVEVEPPPSMLGPEDPAALTALGFRLYEFPKFHRWERIAQHPGETFEEIEIVLAVGGNRVAYASVFDVHNECAWRSKSPDRFVFENNAACDLGALLSREKYQTRLRLATDVVYVGTESFPNSPIVTECHGTLARCRVVELARASRRARPDDWALRRHWALDLGEAIADDATHEFDQRRAIIVGVKERIETLPLDQVVRDVVLSTKIKGVDLGAYTRSNTATLETMTLVDNPPPHEKP